MKEILKYYCKTEINKFKNSSIYSKLNELAASYKFNLKLDFGKAKEEKDKNLYLSLSVFNENGELVEISDDGFLTISTMLVLVDKKDRYKFFSWQSKEFIEDLNWIINQLTQL